MAQGNPRCLACNGRGGFMANGHWHRCQCVRATAKQLQLQRRMNSIGAKPSLKALRLFNQDEYDRKENRNG